MFDARTAGDTGAGERGSREAGQNEDESDKTTRTGIRDDSDDACVLRRGNT